MKTKATTLKTKPIAVEPVSKQETSVRSELDSFKISANRGCYAMFWPIHIEFKEKTYKCKKSLLVKYKDLPLLAFFRDKDGMACVKTSDRSYITRIRTRRTASKSLEVEPLSVTIKEDGTPAMYVPPLSKAERAKERAAEVVAQAERDKARIDAQALKKLVKIEKKVNAVKPA